MRPASRVLPLLLFVLATACGDNLRPDLPGEVGPAPLRRLSDAEYHNALHDLFPAVAPTLPELPPEAVIGGFDNAAEAQEPSDLRVGRYETIAHLYAEAVAGTPEAVQRLVACDRATPSAADACAAELLERWGLQLFRRPLTGDELDRFARSFRAWQTSIDFDAAVQLTLAAMLQSPQFLYRAEPPPPPGTIAPVEPYAMASRLSFLLWESTPDDALLEAAARDQLRTPAQLRAQAERMLADPRARRVYWSFYRQALGLDRILSDEHVVRTPDIDPAWTAASAASAWTESRLFVENTLMATGSLRALLTSRDAWVDAETARLYGVAAPAEPWSKVTLPAGERAGILTRAAFLAGLAHRGGNSPPLRGNGLRLRLLCQLTRPPPPGADLSMPVPAPGEGPQTTRTLFERRTSPDFCQGCHVPLNGYGFGFEHYTATGAYQATERGLPIDATGALHDTDVDGPFDGALDLSAQLADSRVVALCNVEQWMRYALGRAPVEGEAATVDALFDRFVDSDGDVRQLLIDLVTAPSFRLQRGEEP